MKTIFHIGSDKITRRLVKDALDYTGNVIDVTDAPTAIQYCAMLQPDLILIDIDLIGLNGAELVLRLKMFMPKVPIVLLGSGPVEKLIAIPEADGVVPKPVDPAALREMTRLWLLDPDSTNSEQESIAQFEHKIADLNKANQRLAALNAIGALISTSLDLEHLTDEILHQIQKTVDFDSATIFLLKGDILEAAASRGLTEYRRGLNIYKKSDRNSAWRAVTNRLPLIINDVTQSGYWEPRPELSRIRSWLGVPLVNKDRVVGVLTLDKNMPDAFSDADARYVFTLAFQIAIAVENAKLFEELEDQTTRLKLINELNQEITTVLDVDNLYHVLARAIIERLNYDNVTVFTLNADRSGLRLRACYRRDNGSAQRLDSPVYPDDTKKGLLGEAIELGRPIIASNTTVDDVPVAGIPVRSALILPVFIDTNAEAVIAVGSRRPNRFSDQDLWTVSSLTTHASTVIKNARLYQAVDTYSEELERTVVARTQRLQAIKKIGQVISQGVELEELLAVVGQGIGQIFDESAGAAVEVATGLINGSHLSVKVIYRAHTPSLHSNGHMVESDHPLDHQSAVGQVVARSESVVLNNVDMAGIYQAASPGAADSVNSLLVTPLITAGKTIGVIMVTSQQPYAFDNHDLETLESVAFQVASAIEYARLLRKTKELAIIDERTRLARDMHDGVAQNLAYLLIQVDRCLAMVDSSSKLEERLEQISTLLRQNIDELRRNIFDLRPVALEGKSLFEVLENFVTEFGRRWNLKMTYRAQSYSDDIPADVERALYRILQEALSNARRHARCRHVTIELSVPDGQWIVLKIEDDGLGFDLPNQQQSNDQRRGLGLISMKERAENAGGRLAISSVPGRGTDILAELPLPAAQRSPQYRKG